MIKRLTDKDMVLLKEQDAPRDQSELSISTVRDSTHQHRVDIMWNINEDTKKDRMFKLTIDDDIEVILDAEQVMRILRWV